MTTTRSGLSSISEITDWSAAFSRLAFVGGEPATTGRVKSCPADFQVDEQMSYVPAGEGEHIWLKVRKEKQNTEQVAKALARFSGVANRDVGYSGMKDFQAITTQWFSIWQPQQTPLDWSQFTLHGVELLEVSRHTRKLKRGTHQANRFHITVRDLAADPDLLEARLQQIKRAGVPNYFGPQRFGRGFSNLGLAYTLLVEQKAIKNRNLRSIVLSAARAWLFNNVISQRIEQGTWNQLFLGEPANLDGTNSTFKATVSEQESTRLEALDIHCTGPMVGRGESAAMEACPNLQALEADWLAPYQTFIDGLCSLGLDYQRRALRSRVSDLSWSIESDCLELQFSLQRGQYATSVLRELINESA